MPSIIKKRCVSSASGADPQISAFRFGPMALWISGNITRRSDERHIFSSHDPRPELKKQFWARFKIAGKTPLRLWIVSVIFARTLSSKVGIFFSSRRRHTRWAADPAGEALKVEINDRGCVERQPL